MLVLPKPQFQLLKLLFKQEETIEKAESDKEFLFVNFKFMC